ERIGAGARRALLVGGALARRALSARRVCERCLSVAAPRATSAAPESRPPLTADNELQIGMPYATSIAGATIRWFAHRRVPTIEVPAPGRRAATGDDGRARSRWLAPRVARRSKDRLAA